MLNFLIAIEDFARGIADMAEEIAKSLDKIEPEPESESQDDGSEVRTFGEPDPIFKEAEGQNYPTSPDYDYLEFQHLSKQIPADEYIRMLFEKYRLLEADMLLKRRDEIVHLFDVLITLRQAGLSPADGLANQILEKLNSKNELPDDTGRVHPRIIRDNSQA